MKRDVIDLLNKNQDDIRFLLDSGAFTAWKAGKTIQVDDYCKFIESLPFKPWRYFTLDVIGDPEKSFKNYELMLSRGFKPIPIFTRGEDIKMIDEYYKTSDVVGIGGLVGTQGNKGFVKGIMNVVGDRKVHWLGFTNDNFVIHYKPYSIDSSSWTMGGRFAHISLYLGQGKSMSIKKKDFLSQPKTRVQKALQSYKVDQNLLAKSSSWNGGLSIPRFLSAKSQVRKSTDFEKNIKTKVFAAVSTAQEVGQLINAYKEEKNENISRIIGRNGLVNSTGMGETTP
jgi:hypothetical protein